MKQIYNPLNFIWLVAILLSTMGLDAQTVTNGSVTGAPRGNSMVPNAAGWSTCSFSPDLCDVTHPSYVTNSAVTPVPSPDGGTWVGLASLGECAQTTITGLTIGTTYTLYFCGACFGTGTSIYNGGPARPVVTVVGATAGSQQFNIPMAASTWNNYQMTFTATAATHTLQLSHPNTVSPQAYASLDGFSLSNPCGILLPVELFDFVAELRKDNSVLLSWKTVTELNSEYFAIERSMDGLEFEEIGRKPAAGNSNQTLFYTYIDEELPARNGVFYYRIRSVGDKDGFSLSDVRVVSVLNNTQGALNVYPNPAKDFINIDFWLNEVPEETARLRILNAFGQVVYEQILNLNIRANQMSIGIENLSAGQYVLEININELGYRQKIVKQ